MRNKSFLAVLLLAAGTCTQAQKTYTVNSINNNSEDLIRGAYRYPEFRRGVVLYNDGVTTNARLNYHRLYDQVLFISPRGDTLALARPEEYRYVAIGTDTFDVQGQGYVERLTHYAGVNLARKGTIGFSRHEQKGAFGTYSSTMVSEARSNYSSDGSSVTRLQVDENIIYKDKSRYFLSDAYHQFYPATKKSFYNLFRKQEKQLKEYLDSHDVNFAREGDLLQLLEYLQGGR